jgi:hypothetical protein
MVKISLCPAVNLAIYCSGIQETFISLLWTSAIPNFSQVEKETMWKKRLRIHLRFKIKQDFRETDA